MRPGLRPACGDDGVLGRGDGGCELVRGGRSESSGCMACITLPVSIACAFDGQHRGAAVLAWSRQRHRRRGNDQVSGGGVTGDGSGFCRLSVWLVVFAV